MVRTLLPLVLSSMLATPLPLLPACVGEECLSWLDVRRNETEESHWTLVEYASDGDTLYLAGSVDGEFLLQARHASNGSVAWSASRPGAGALWPQALAVHPETGQVLVSGIWNHPQQGFRGWLAAWDTDGAPLWQRLEPKAARVHALAIHDRSAVAVISEGDGDRVALFDLGTGEEIWRTGFLPATRLNAAAVAPSRQLVALVGGACPTLGCFSPTLDGLALGLDLETGAERWRHIHRGPNADTSYHAALAPDESTLYATGITTGANGFDIWISAYDLADGGQRWSTAHDGPGHGLDVMAGIAVTPDGRRILVGGTEASGPCVHVPDPFFHPCLTRPEASADFVTLGLDARDGAIVWRDAYDDELHGVDVMWDVALSADGSKFFVTGPSTGAIVGGWPIPDVAVLAYEPLTGARLWEHRYDGPGRFEDHPQAISADPRGHGIAVAGYTSKVRDDLSIDTDALVLAYRTPAAMAALSVTNPN